MGNPTLMELKGKIYMDILKWLQEWYKSNCDGDWEHMYGITINNVDNPGWRVEIELVDTKENDKVFNKIQYDNSDGDWLLCYVEDNIFYGNGDSDKLIEILTTFRNWVEKNN